MVLLSSLFSEPRPSRSRWRPKGRRRSTPHLLGPKRSEGCQAGDFLVSRGMAAQPTGEESCPPGIAASRTRRSRCPARSGHQRDPNGRVSRNRGTRRTGECHHRKTAHVALLKSGCLLPDDVRSCGGNQRQRACSVAIATSFGGKAEVATAPSASLGARPSRGHVRQIRASIPLQLRVRRETKTSPRFRWGCGVVGLRRQRHLGHAPAYQAEAPQAVSKPCFRLRRRR
jgi:hypothetical protein